MSSQARRIGFLHTADVHVATFDRLLAPVAATHAVDASLLDDARRLGLADDGLHDRVSAAMARLGVCDVIVCTCSTIGGIAESIGSEHGLAVVRVDRPMAEEAIRIAASGRGRIGVVAALANTVEPTTGLLAEVADDAGHEITLDVMVVDGAWERFEAGDRVGYIHTVAEALPAVAAGVDVVVLAQASMADVATAVDVDVPVLSSPPLAVRSLLGG